MDTEIFSQTVQDYPVSALQLEKPQLYLIVIEGVDRGKVFLLEQGSNIFGRNPESDITLQDQKMSRSHGIFHLDGDSVTCEDLRSTNGTYVDGEPIKTKIISLASRIRIGDSVMKVSIMTDSERDAQMETEQAATIDPLTGAYNRNGFYTYAKIDLAKAAQFKLPISFLMLDIDHFKKLNDSLGHSAGDEALKEFCRRVKSQLRNQDHLMRYGGEEFVILLSNTPPDIAKIVAERIRCCIAKDSFILEGQQQSVTVSIGVYTGIPSTDEDIDSIIKEVDKALYKAKSLGRNRSEVYTDHYTHEETKR